MINVYDAMRDRYGDLPTYSRAEKIHRFLKQRYDIGYDDGELCPSLDKPCPAKLSKSLQNIGATIPEINRMRESHSDSCISKILARLEYNSNIEFKLSYLKKTLQNKLNARQRSQSA